MTNCHTDRVSAGLCETIVELGQRFGLKTVAEGIETTHECHKLQAIGCNIGQGYLFAKPMPKDIGFIGLMRKRLVPAGLARRAGRLARRATDGLRADVHAGLIGNRHPASVTCG